jgi:hypothetical protein
MKTGTKTSGIETFGEGTKWKKKGKKEGGARDAGGEGGIYLNEKEGLTALIKKDDRIEFNIAEYLGSQLFAALEPSSGAKVQLMVSDTDKTGIPNDGSNVYVRSEFFQNYSDMFKDMDKGMPEKDKPSKYFRKDGRPLMMGTREFFSKTLSKAFKSQDYQDFDKIGPLSLLMGDFDFHPGNIGVIRKGDEKPRLVRIDFGWAFSNMTNDVHPHSFSKHLPGMGPTNHFREFSDDLKFTPEFVNSLNKAAGMDINKVLDESFVNLEKCYNQEALAKWAKHVMPSIYKDKDIKDIHVADVKEDLKKIMVNRQKSLKEFSLEINLGLLFEKDKKGKYKNEISPQNREALKNLIRENPDYFESIDSGKKQLRLRDSELGRNAKQLLEKEIHILRAEVLKEEVGVRKEKGLIIDKTVERGGKAYTLPVTKAQYNELKIEPEKNRNFDGLGAQVTTTGYDKTAKGPEKTRAQKADQAPSVQTTAPEKDTKKDLKIAQLDPRIAQLAKVIGDSTKSGTKPRANNTVQQSTNNHATGGHNPGRN